MRSTRGKRLCRGHLAFFLLIFTCLPAWADSPLVIGTGGSAGVYLPVGKAMCELYRQATGSACQALTTGGSLYNASAIRNGDLDFGIVQSDIQYALSRGTEQFYDSGPNESVRTLFSLHAEAFTVVAKPPGIRNFDDLAGKWVNVGNPGSGQRATLNSLLEMKGETEDIFALASELKPTDMSRVMCSGKLDAFLYVVGHPSQAIDEAIRGCGAHLVNVAGPEVDSLIEQMPYYGVTVIPGGTYAHNPDDIVTFGVRATLLSRKDVDEERVYQLVKAVFEHLDAFRRSHPSLVTLTPSAMVREGLTVPLHAGARRYYEEVGLLPPGSE